MRPLAIAIAAAVHAVTSSALAAGPAVTLNGVNIDGVSNQRFENATVVIDAQGNIDIQAKGYAARVEASSPAATQPPPSAPATSVSPAAPAAAAANTTVAASARPTPGKLTHRYFLVTEQSQPDGTQYDVKVFINASWIRDLKSADPQVVTEISRFLRPGPNKITFAATKRRDGGERRSVARDVTLKVVVGEGNVGGDQVMIDEPLVVMTRNASETEDKVEEFVVEAR